jgi:hypothetical protein
MRTFTVPKDSMPVCTMEESGHAVRRRPVDRHPVRLEGLADLAGAVAQGLVGIRRLRKARCKPVEIHGDLSFRNRTY